MTVTDANVSRDDSLCGFTSSSIKLPEIIQITRKVAVMAAVL
jgi:hypothetical protein